MNFRNRPIFSRVAHLVSRWGSDDRVTGWLATYESFPVRDKKALDQDAVRRDDRFRRRS